MADWIGTVHYDRQGEIALLNIDNPPVNPAQLVP